MRGLDDIRAAMRGAEPVFIVGCPRSGSSLLYRTLLKHSAFTSPDLRAADPFQQISETYIFRHAGASHRIPRDGQPFLQDYMLGDENCYRAFLEAIEPVRRLHRWGPSVVGPYLARHSTAVWKLGRNPDVVQAFFYYAHRARGGRRILEKTPYHHLYMRMMEVAFPRCRLLIVFRHPIDVYTSYRKRYQREPGAQWADLSFRDFCRRYAQTVRIVDAYRRRGGRALLELRYEELTERPEAELGRVLEFLGEPFEANLVGEASDPRASWDVDPHLFGAIVQKTKAWQEFLTAAEAAEIEDRLAEAMIQLGYRRYTDR